MLQNKAWLWEGELSQAARTILHQHMIQGDLTDLQVAALRWRALFNKAKSEQINYRVLYESLRNLEDRWERDLVSAAEVSNCVNTHLHFRELFVWKACASYL